nr:hypothetical protein L203_05698 [Cryptococcus depauperatus CBS 7841]
MHQAGPRFQSVNEESRVGQATSLRRLYGGNHALRNRIERWDGLISQERREILACGACRDTYNEGFVATSGMGASRPDQDSTMTFVEATALAVYHVSACCEQQASGDENHVGLRVGNGI